MSDFELYPTPKVGVTIVATYKETPKMKDEQIKHMVDRFLGWNLPNDFHPDGGINFDADAGKRLNAANRRYEPIGTNLFSATQADGMVRHMVEGLPEAAASSHSLLLTPEYARLCGIAAAASGLAAVYPERCTAHPNEKHPENCHCGQVLLDRALRATV